MSNIPRVYTLGNSPLANYFAYAISKISSQPQIPNVVLLLSDKKKLDRFLEHDSTLTLLDDNSSDRSNSMQFMAACSPPTYANGNPAVIDNLILAEQSKKHFTFLLDFYSRSLRDTTNLLLLNPPMGALEYVYDKIWSEPKQVLRPNLWIGITKQEENSLYRKQKPKGRVTSEFDINIELHGGTLPLFVTQMPRELQIPLKQQKNLTTIPNLNDLPSTDNELIDLIRGTDSVAVNPITYAELLLLSYERLIVQSCTEPLALLYDCKYPSELLKLDKALIMIQSLIKEQVKILYTAFPFLKGVPGHELAFDVDRLYSLVLAKLDRHPNQKSELVEQANGLNATNINQMNGYFVRLAYASRIDCRWNEVLTWFVKGKVQLMKQRALDYHYL